MKLDIDAARSVISELALKMGVSSVEEAAWGVIQVANATMERAIRRISVERGYDPRRFTLVAFGGAGPLHACELAQNLQIPKVLIPAIPGVLSALGMLVAAPTKDYSQTVMQEVADVGDRLKMELDGRYARLLERAVSEMTAEGYAADSIVQQRSLDVRYVGQSHELTIPHEDEDIIKVFHAAHTKRFGYQRPDAPVEIVTLRLSVIVPVKPPAMNEHVPDGGQSSTAVVGEKGVWFAGKMTPTTLYDRDKLHPGQQFGGPAVLFQYDTTTVIPPEWQATVDGSANLILSNSAQIDHAAM